MNLARAWSLASLIVVASWHPAPATAQTQSAAISKERVTFKSGSLTLVGFLFKPDGAGPFPALVWNHGSVRLLEGEHLDDQLAGQAYVKRLPYVDPQRLVVAGCSFGGIETLLAAERGAGYGAAVAISPGAQSWNGNALRRDRLVTAVREAEIPVFLIQPPKDASLEPSRVLGAELERHGKQNAVKVYTPDMPEDQQGHCFGGARGMHVWAQDVLTFFAGALR